MFIVKTKMLGICLPSLYKINKKRKNFYEAFLTKILIDELFNFSQELSRRRDPTEKSIVVSQFTCLLSIIQPILSESGVNWTRLDGSMSIRDRLAVIEEFQNPGKGTPTVLLLSLRAGNFDLSVIVLQTNFKRGKVFVVLFVY